MAPASRYDVLIAGGAVMGSSAAYFLKQLAPACSIAVVEPDEVYEFASTLRASGGARRLFSCPENIELHSATGSVDALQANYETQRQHGVNVELIVHKRFETVANRPYAERGIL